MSEYQFVDELVKEYLVFRGFTATLKHFDIDLKFEKEKGFRVDRVLEAMNHYISIHDLTSLTDTWKHFENNIFSKLEPSKVTSVKKLESSILKLYLINCLQNKQAEKVREFFEKLTPEIQGQNEWKDWFALPYIKEPQENPQFSLYYSRHWQDTLMISLHNFLTICFQALPPPRLVEYQKTASRIRLLKEEQKNLKLKLAQVGGDEDPNLSTGNIKYFEAPPAQDIMDDFFLIAQEASRTETQLKSIKSFLKNITGQKKSPTSQSINRNRITPNTLSINKTPLKRVSPALSKPHIVLPSPNDANDAPSNQSDASPNPPDAGTAVQSDTGSVDVEILEVHDKDLESEPPASPATPANPNRLLLLGQDEYHEHRSSVVALKVSTAGLVASADVSGVVKVWNPGPSSQPTTKATFISASPVSCLTWIDERRLVYGTQMGQVRMCDVEDKCLVLETACTSLAGQPISVLAASPVGSLFFACSASKSLIINSKNFNVEAEINDDALTGLTAAHYNHNGSLLVFASNRGDVGIYDLHRSEVLVTWRAHEKGVLSLELTSDETGVWSLGKDGQLLQSSLLRPGEKIWRGHLNASESYVGDFALSPDGDHVLYGSEDGVVVYRLTETEGELLRVLGIRGETPVTSVFWGAGDCGTILAAGMDGSVKISTLLKQ